MTPSDYRHLSYQLMRRHQGVRVKGRPLLIEMSRKSHPDNAGVFDPNTCSIEVFGYRLSEQAIFLTLCHELGHWESWSRGEDVGGADDLEEERRAWRYGLKFATDVGFEDADLYRTFAAEILEISALLQARLPPS